MAGGQHERREQQVVERSPVGITRSASPTGMAGSRSSMPGQREDRGADERAGGDGGERDDGRAAGVLADPAGEVARRRPAPAPSGRRRGRPAAPGRSASPPTKPSTAANSGPRVSPAATTTSRTRFGTTPLVGEVAKKLTCSTTATSRSSDEERAPRTSGMSAASWLVGASSAGHLAGLDHRTVALGVAVDDDPDEVEGREVDERVDHRVLGLLARAGEHRLDGADRDAGDVRRAVAAAPGDDDVVLARCLGVVDEVEVEAAVAAEVAAALAGSRPRRSSRAGRRRPTPGRRRAARSRCPGWRGSPGRRVRRC